MILDAYPVYLADLTANEQNEAARAAVAEFTRIAEELRQPYNLWRALLYQSAIAQELGQFAEAERLTREALRVGLSASPENAIQLGSAQLFLINATRSVPIPAITSSRSGSSWRTRQVSSPNSPTIRCAIPNPTP